MRNSILLLTWLSGYGLQNFTYGMRRSNLLCRADVSDGSLDAFAARRRALHTQLTAATVVSGAVRRGGGLLLTLPSTVLDQLLVYGRRAAGDDTGLRTGEADLLCDPWGYLHRGVERSLSLLLTSTLFLAHHSDRHCVRLTLVPRKSRISETLIVA